MVNSRRARGGVNPWEAQILRTVPGLFKKLATPQKFLEARAGAIFWCGPSKGTASLESFCTCKLNRRKFLTGLDA